MLVERGDELVDARDRRERRRPRRPATSRLPTERSAALRSRRARRATSPEVGLRHDEHVGDLHDPGLQELQDVARAGLHDDRDRVGDLGDVGLALADADRLDDDDVEGRGQRLGRRARRRAPGRRGARRRRSSG